MLTLDTPDIATQVFWLSLGTYTDPTKQISTLLAEAPSDLYCPFGFYLLVWGEYLRL